MRTIAPPHSTLFPCHSMGPLRASSISLLCFLAVKVMRACPASPASRFPHQLRANKDGSTLCGRRYVSAHQSKFPFKLVYSTPQRYFDAVEGTTFSGYSGDFFPASFSDHYVSLARSHTRTRASSTCNHGFIWHSLTSRDDPRLDDRNCGTVWP